MSLIHGVYRPHAAGPARVARPRSDEGSTRRHRGRRPRPAHPVPRRHREPDAALQPLRREDRVMAALGAAMTRLAAERAAGAHPCLGTVEHTRWAGRRGRHCVATSGDDAPALAGT